MSEPTTAEERAVIAEWARRQGFNDVRRLIADVERLEAERAELTGACYECSQALAIKEGSDEAS